jgi:hypothetical protein
MRFAAAGMASMMLVFLALILSAIPVINLLCFPFLVAGTLFIHYCHQVRGYVAYWDAINNVGFAINVLITWVVLFLLMERGTSNARQQGEPS